MLGGEMAESLNEADTCRKFITPKIIAAGWDNAPYSFTEQKTFTDGRVVMGSQKPRRGKQKRADYLLRYSHDLAIAVVEAKPYDNHPAEGLQQAKEYAEILGLQFAYSTNGQFIIEHDYITGLEKELTEFPNPQDLWSRYLNSRGLPEDKKSLLIAPYDHTSGKESRYYQEIAINRAIEEIVKGKKRLLLTLATGTGKTFIAFQICWKLWNARWNSTGEYRRPKILYLSDRNILVDDPKDKIFAPFGDARWKIEGMANKSREMYFSTYQSIAEDERRPGLFKEFSRDFFDLIIVDECHRGSARDESKWRGILEYFEPAYQIGMTATPLRDDNRDTYSYFGNPIYTYSLKQGIEDGFLAPYRVYRIVTNVDAAGWRPSKGEVDKYGKEIPDAIYNTKEFEKVIALRARTHAIAQHLTDFMKQDDRFAKTIIFCVDQEHALEMARELNNLNSDLTKQYPDYVCRVTADEGDIGRGHLSKFQELETKTPVILTTSQLLTTGVDAPTVKNVVIARVVGSITEFKQMVGRGTRLRDDYDKWFFNIFDYTGSAVQQFADPDFDGEPLPSGRTISFSVGTGEGDGKEKYHVDGGYVTIDTEMVYEMDSGGHQLKVVKITDFTTESIRTLYPDKEMLRRDWATSTKRQEIIEMLESRGISIDELAKVMKKPEADAFDLLCNLAYSAPLKTRRDRAEALKGNTDFFDQFSEEARTILNEVLEKYAEHGSEQFTLPDVLKISPISSHGNIGEIIKIFGSAEGLKNAFDEMQALIYSE
jgi:type I restriction enzyme R subunit